jgi:hypothetical protein
MGYVQGAIQVVKSCAGAIYVQPKKNPFIISILLAMMEA